MNLELSTSLKLTITETVKMVKRRGYNVKFAYKIVCLEKGNYDVYVYCHDILVSYACSFCGDVGNFHIHE